MHALGFKKVCRTDYLSRNAESFISAPPNHNTSWWFSDQLDLDDSYPPHHVLVPQQSMCTAEPPPYTEVAQNGHISLGQSPIKPVDTSQEGGNAENNNMDSSTLTTNNISVLEASQNGEDADDSYMDSSQNASSDSPSQSQSPFHPTRQSTPILGRRLQLPPLHRSSSADASDTPTTDGNPQQRYSLAYVPLSLHSSLPPRLRPISTPFSQQDDTTHTNESTNNMENIGPFPIRPGRLPPLQSALNRQDQHRRVSVGSDGPNQLPRRRKKKRKRTNTWHGERLGTEMIHTIQEVNALGVVTE